MAIVVTGATGNVGRPLVAELVGAGAQVRVVSRNPGSARLPARVEVVRSAAEAMRGASAAFLNSRALGGALAAVVQRAQREGVTRLVALSAINADDDFSRQPSRFRGDRNKEVEQLAVDSGLEWVSLRPSDFASNFAGMWASQIQGGDIVSGPYAAASSVPIAESDIAAVAARALLSDELVGQKVPLTGPQAFTNAELVEVIGSVLHRPLRYQEVTPDVVRELFIGMGFPTAFADAYLQLQSSRVDTPALVTHEIEKTLGRPPESFAQWIAEHQSLFTKYSHDLRP